MNVFLDYKEEGGEMELKCDKYQHVLMKNLYSIKALGHFGMNRGDEEKKNKNKKRILENSKNYRKRNKMIECLRYLDKHGHHVLGFCIGPDGNVYGYMSQSYIESHKPNYELITPRTKELSFQNKARYMGMNPSVGNSKCAVELNSMFVNRNVKSN